MNIPCSTPLMVTWIFSEMLLANTFPLASRNGVGRPGLQSSKTPARASTETSKTETAVNMTRRAFRAKARTADPLPSSSTIVPFLLATGSALELVPSDHLSSTP
jgi:hypothetical protein